MSRLTEEGNDPVFVFAMSISFVLYYDMRT